MAEDASRLTVIGVDCATEPAKVGLAAGEWLDGRFAVRDVRLGGKSAPLKTVAEWISRSKGPVLLALDAPLGWPVSMGDVLPDHSAGDAIPVDKNVMFTRETDRRVWNKLGKKPLEVGADRIARTAHGALSFLGDLRYEIGHPVPLAWDPHDLAEVSAIEVYPAATLIAHGILSTGYKKPETVRVRTEIVEELGGHLELRIDPSLLTINADALDAVVCLLAAKDFLDGKAERPQDLALARREGWIWFADPRS